MNLLLELIQTLLDTWEMEASQLTEIVIVPCLYEGDMALHVQPEQDYFAMAHYRAGEWWISTHDYL